MTKSKRSTPTPNKRVLAVDPGYDRVGYAVLEGNDVLISGCITTDRKSVHEARLLAIGEALTSVIKEWHPSSLALEKLFFNQNVSTAIKVAEARGVIAYTAAKEGLAMYEYSPQDIKLAVASYGKASKNQVETMVRKLVSLPEEGKRLDDEIDAIALGITHLATRRGI